MKEKIVEYSSNCRICGSRNLKEFLNLGEMPLANGFLREEELKLAEPKYPVDISYCQDCGLTQLVSIVPKELLFRTYPYFSSVSLTFKLHCENLAKEVIEKFKFPSDSLVVEIGSNDGVLLKIFKKYNFRILGIEPAVNVARVAQEEGVDTINEFFSEELAYRIANEIGKADVILALNVFNHLHFIEDVMRGIKYLLKEKGIFVIEVPYFLDLINKNSFDTMYHEMHSYFSLRPLKVLFNQFDMEIIDVKRIDIHTGSIRIYVKKKENPLKIEDTVELLLEEEVKLGLYNIKNYLKFIERINSIKIKLNEILENIKREGKRIIGYGAAAKGNVLLNYCNIRKDILDYIVDATPWKQGLYTPGTHIPVYLIEKFRKDNPDYVLILPWNFAKEIMEKEKEFMRRGGKFIIPLPYPQIVH